MDFSHFMSLWIVLSAAAFGEAVSRCPRVAVINLRSFHHEVYPAIHYIFQSAGYCVTTFAEDADIFRMKDITQSWNFRTRNISVNMNDLKEMFNAITALRNVTENSREIVTLAKNDLLQFAGIRKDPLYDFCKFDVVVFSSTEYSTNLK
jgi:hypothetical protein